MVDVAANIVMIMSRTGSDGSNGSGGHLMMVISLGVVIVGASDIDDDGTGGQHLGAG
jgi:hypothetical protein